MAVNKRRVRAWVKALRSGEYRQGNFMLRPTDDTYCCLGVACEVAQLPYRANAGALPDEVAEYYGLDNDPLLTSRYTCVAANDPGGWSFKRIATAIEKRYL